MIPPFRCRHGVGDSPGAFTRIELLAVAAGLWVAALLALPSLGRTQVRSELALCLSNQRQLIQAFLLYATENQDGILANSWTSTNQTLDLTSGGYWPGPARVVGSGGTPEAALVSTWEGLARGPLWNYVTEVHPYHCPADRRWMVLRPGAGWGWDSYTKAAGMGTGLLPGMKPFARGADVRDPSMSAVFIEETDPRGSNLGAWSLGIQPPSWTDVPSALHDDGGMFGFFDGHAEVRRWSEATTLRAARDAMRGRQSFFFSGASATNPDFRWVYDRYQHLSWRALP